MKFEMNDEMIERFEGLGCDVVETTNGMKIPGWFMQSNRDNLERLIKEHDVKSVIEIGSFLGASAAWFAERVDRVHCVDKWVETEEEGSYNNLVWTCERTGLPRNFYHVFVDNMKRAGVFGKIIPSRHWSFRAACLVPDVDLVYIDGDHSLAGCREDILNYLPKARKVICGDDYARRPDWGVIQAVSSLLPAHQHAFPFWWSVRRPETEMRKSFGI